MKIVAKNQNVRSTRCVADDAFEQIVEALDHPLEKVLRPAGHLRHPARRDLSEDDEADGDDPRDHHRVGDRKAERSADFDRVLRQPVLHGLRQREEAGGEGTHAVAGLSTAHAIAGTARPGSGCATRADHVETRAAWNVTGAGDPPASRMLSAMPEERQVSLRCRRPSALRGKEVLRPAPVGAELVRLLQPLSAPAAAGKGVSDASTDRTNVWTRAGGRGSGRAAGPRATGNLYGDSVQSRPLAGRPQPLP